MLFFKFQIACLIVSLYIIFLYVKQTTHGEILCNKYFDVMMIISPWAIILDGATAWTVNHIDIVPESVNLILHGLFFILMDSLIIVFFVYTLAITKGLPKKFWKKALLFLPFLISVAIIIIFLKDLSYIQGKTTNYSMGISVYTCYATVIIYFIAISVILFVRRKTIEKRKILGVATFLVINGVLLAIQSFFPETLVSALMPTIFILGFYINIEDPALRLLKKYNSNMVLSFANLVESRDLSTGGHVKRTRDYVRILLQEMKKTNKYNYILTKDYENYVIQAAPMHDLGKISTPDEILQKKGKLTDEEFAIIQQHPAQGGELIIENFASLNEPDFLKIAYNLTRYHHEKWNGTGYPEGLKEEEIPLSARIMAVADVFDAVSSNRCYRGAMPIEECFKIIGDGAGTHFDPDLAQLFLEAKDKVVEVYETDKNLYTPTSLPQ